MPALDQCHDQVVRALQKDGWQLEASPSRLYLPYRYVYVDLRMSRRVNGKWEQLMLVEVKCFPDENNTTPDLYLALGQYLIYRTIVLELNLSVPLYLSVPEHIFAEIFDPAVMRTIRDNQINIVVINLEQEKVIKWIEQ